MRSPRKANCSKGQGAKSPAYSLLARAAGLPKWTGPLVNSVMNPGKPDRLPQV